MAEVILEKVFKNYGQVAVVKDLNLRIHDGEFLILVGPSGCGKSTILRMVAGLEELSAGHIYIGHGVVNDLPPKERDVAMVFQNYALYPHMKVYENMAFGLKLRKIPREEIDRRVREAAEILGIGGILQRHPKELSGGQRQRVALGRAIVREPQVFLMDEPLSNLDAKLRVQMRAELSKLHQRLKTTTIYVTHDQTEAMTMGHRVVVLKDGVVQQVGTPEETYHHPANLFVAGFIGSPQTNFMECTVSRRGDTLYLDGGPFKLRVPPMRTKAILPYTGQSIILGVRPEDVLVGAEAHRYPESSLSAKVEVVEPLGAEVHLYLKSGAHQLIARVDPRIHPGNGETVPVAIRIEKMHAFNKGTEKALW